MLVWYLLQMLSALDAILPSAVAWGVISLPIPPYQGIYCGTSPPGILVVAWKTPLQVPCTLISPGYADGIIRTLHKAPVRRCE